MWTTPVKSRDVVYQMSASEEKALGEGTACQHFAPRLERHGHRRGSVPRVKPVRVLPACNWQMFCPAAAALRRYQSASA
jgi:hypothetical protein